MCFDQNHEKECKHEEVYCDCDKTCTSCGRKTSDSFQKCQSGAEKLMSADKMFIGGDSSNGLRPTCDSLQEPKVKGSYNIGPVARSNGKKVVVSIRGPIGGFFGVESSAFIRDLQSKASNADSIEVLINSGGGDVFEATAIYNALQSHKAEVTTIIEGVAASAATLIAQAGDKRLVPSNIYYMVHEVRGGIHGTAQELRNYIKLLDIANDNISKLYAKRGGKEKTYVDDLLLNGDNWLTPEQVVEHGFADEVIGERKADPVVTPNDKINISWTDRNWSKTGQIESDLRTLAASVGEEMPKFIENGMTLANLLNESIDSISDGNTSTRSRSDVINEMSAEASISVEEVNGILDAGTNCPGITSLLAFARIEGLPSFNRMRTAAETDGCSFDSADNNLQGLDMPKTSQDAKQARIEQLKSELALENACGGDKELIIEALENDWTPEMAALKLENKTLTTKVETPDSESSSSNLWAGTFSIPSNQKEKAINREDAIIASIASQFKEVSHDTLMNPFKNLSPEDRMLVQNSTGIKPISEETIEAGFNTFNGDLQELASYCAWKDGKQNNPFQFNDVRTIQASFSSVTFPKKFLEVCERAMLASFQLIAPKWSQVAQAVNVNDLQRHNQYRMYGTGRWEKKPTCGELTHGEIAIEEAHFNQAFTHGQVLEVCRDLILNNQIGSINNITTRFGLMGRMAPEWGVWDHINENMCGESEFEFTISNFEKLWECFCSKGEFELSGVPKDRCEDFKIAIELGNPRLVVARCDRLRITKLLRGRIELCGSGTECKEVAVMDALLDGMVDVCESSYMKRGHVVMLPAPTPMGSAIEVAFLRGRQLPTIEQVSLANNKLGFGIRGFIDFGVNATSNPFWCNQDMVNDMAASEQLRQNQISALSKSIGK